MAPCEDSCRSHDDRTRLAGRASTPGPGSRRRSVLSGRRAARRRGRTQLRMVDSNRAVGVAQASATRPGSLVDAPAGGSGLRRTAVAWRPGRTQSLEPPAKENMQGTGVVGGVSQGTNCAHHVVCSSGARLEGGASRLASTPAPTSTRWAERRGPRDRCPRTRRLGRRHTGEAFGTSRRTSGVSPTSGARSHHTTRRHDVVGRPATRRRRV